MNSTLVNDPLDTNEKIINHLAQSFFVAFICCSFIGDSYALFQKCIRHEFIQKRVHKSIEIYNILTSYLNKQYCKDLDGNLIIENPKKCTTNKNKNGKKKKIERSVSIPNEQSVKYDHVSVLEEVNEAVIDKTKQENHDIIETSSLSNEIVNESPTESTNESTREKIDCSMRNVSSEWEENKKNITTERVDRNIKEIVIKPNHSKKENHETQIETHTHTEIIKSSKSKKKRH